LTHPTESATDTYGPSETSFVTLNEEDAAAGRWDFESFDCGEPPYNEWLRDHAAEQVRARTAGVHLLVSDRAEDRDRILGYFALGLTVVRRDEVPKALQGGGSSPTSASYLLAKLGLHVDLRGRQVGDDPNVTWGKVLVREALAACVRAGGDFGGRLIVVDADNPRLIKYYENLGFRAMRDGDGNLLHLRLAMKTSTAAQALTKSS
jgi:GNAT superfamily N-acetyltransferase